jgi:hypothetical protein
MDFWNSARKRGNVGLPWNDTIHQPLLPKCYDTFSGTKIYNIIEHPPPTGDSIYMCVPYTSCVCVKELGARWDPDARRWWHLSNSTKHVAQCSDVELLLQALTDVHAQSAFAEWPIDLDFMRRAKTLALELDGGFDYSKPRI